MQHDCGSLSLEVPDSWTARTMFLFIEPANAGEKPVSIVVASERRRARESVQEYAWRKSFDTSRRVRDFDLLATTVEQVGGRDAMRMHIRWLDTGGHVEQIVVYVDAGEGGIVSVLCNLCGAPDERWRRALDGVLTSLRFPAPSTPTQRAAPPTPRSPVPDIAPPFIPIPGDRASRTRF
jgi:hypothetical protein